MGQPVGPCPGPHEIERFAAGVPPDAATARHIETCETCAERLRSARDEASFVTRMRTLARAGPEGAPRIPGYRPIGVINAGAQGVVYRAIQESTSRTVAIKTLVPGNNHSARQRVRAEREAEIAARLRHPNIVTVYESRTLSDGRIAVVMEYIDGVSLDAWKPPGESAERRQRELLRVFIAVCSGIHHAHLNGVIHRDLKPDNILVTIDGRPVVLDFGIAKAGGLGTTLTGEFAGTPAYASPEQVEGRPDAVDALTDIYSLGVILYRLVCGALPYDIGGSIFDIAKTIRECNPAPPRRHDPTIAADLEAILLRALSKDKAGRYQSAASFARDLERYLAGDPVDARSGSGWYLLRKAVQLNRRRLAWAAAALVLVLVAGIAVTLSLASAAASARIARERDEQARAERIRARAMTEFLREALPDTDPNNPELGNILGSGLDRLYFRLETGGFADDPLVDQSIRRLWGSVYTGFASGKASTLIAFAEDALRNGLVRLRLEHAGDHNADPEIAATIHQLAGVLLVRQRLVEAETLCRQALAMRKGLPGSAATDIADSRALLARILVAQGKGRLDEARHEAQTALAAFRSLPDRDSDLRIAAMLALEARLDLDAGDTDAAESLAREALTRRLRRLHPIDPDLIASLADATDLAQAAPRSQLAATLAAAWGSSADSLCADLRRDLAILASPETDLGRTARTGRTAVLSKLLRLDEALLGRSDPAIVDVLTAKMRSAQREMLMDERAAAALHAADLLAARFGPKDLSVMVCLEEAASVLTYAGHPDRGADVVRRVCDTWDSFPPSSRDAVLAASCRRRLAWYLLMAGRYAEATPIYERAVEDLRNGLEEENYIVALAESGLALCRFQNGDRAVGESLSAHALDVASRSAVTPPDQLAHIRFVHAHIQQSLGRVPESRSMLEQAWTGFYTDAGPTLPWRATLLTDLIAACEATGDTAAAEHWRAQLESDRHPASVTAAPDAAAAQK